MRARHLFSPFLLPIHVFALAIVLGAAALRHPACLTGTPISWLDALFTATSAVCVTGLVVVDTGSYFTPLGQSVILALIQLGGLGIMTLATLFFYLWRQRVTLSDRVSVGQSLLHDPTFSLGGFLVRLVVWTLVLEMCGALLLHWMLPTVFPPFGALFHAISAFCNAGFSLYADSLTQVAAHPGVNLVVMGLIVLGGLGFSVLVSMESAFFYRKPLDWYSRRVLKTSAMLIVAGAVFLLASEWGTDKSDLAHRVLTAVFQSVTCRTAGLNTVDIAALTEVSLVFMLLLMFIGGAPGSTAGGIKVTTFRVLLGYAIAQFKGRAQTLVGNLGVDAGTMNKALVLAFFSILIVGVATLTLCITEDGGVTHARSGGLFLEVLFESVSAFATVGLSTGVTPHLSEPGKMVVMALMFIGRLGPIVLLSAVQHSREAPRYRYPETQIQIG